jgi:rod shape-determining protein MreD
VKAAILVFTALIFLLLQMIAARSIAIGEIVPDFPLLFVVYLALYRGGFLGTIIGFIIGLVQDLFNPSLLGLNALVKSSLGYVMGRVGAKTMPESILLITLFFFLSKIGHDLVYMIFFYNLNLERLFLSFFTISLPSAVYTALVGMFIHEVCSFLGLKVVKVFGKANQ